MKDEAPAPVATLIEIKVPRRKARAQALARPAKPFAFVEEPPEVIDGTRPVNRPPVKRNEAIAARQAKRFQALPTRGPNEIRVVTAGSRVGLIPSDQVAAIHLDGLRAQVGRHYDAKRSEDVQLLDTMLERGASGFDSIVLLARLNGLTIDSSGAGREEVEGYRRTLRRQKMPIPRVVWRDDTAPVSGQDTGTISLDRRGWRS